MITENQFDGYLSLSLKEEMLKLGSYSRWYWKEIFSKIDVTLNWRKKISQPAESNVSPLKSKLMKRPFHLWACVVINFFWQVTKLFFSFTLKKYLNPLKDFSLGDIQLSLGDLPSQIESSSTIRCRISNSDDDFDMNPIPSRWWSRRSWFWLNFALFFIKVNLFWTVFD